ncbi:MULTISPECIES: RNA polymerase sigma factor [unclassified Lysinibacillus]|uniref:RNA polymerase sigma factor n=1 Tax=unclassified Lysinibacillus TaxID=2636778 RepID=UPI00380DEAC7
MEMQLIQKIIAGDQQAFRIIVDTYKQPLVSYLTYQTNDEELAKDIAQESFIKCYESLLHFKGGSFKAWLFRIAINQLIDFKRKHKEDATPLEETPSLETPESLIIEKEQNELLQQWLKTLEHTTYQVFVLKYASNCSYEEIAETLNIPISEVRNRLHRTKKRLRNAMLKGEINNELLIN